MERRSANGARERAERKDTVVRGVADMGLRRAVSFRGPGTRGPWSDVVCKCTRTAGRGGSGENVESVDKDEGGWLGVLMDTV